MSRNESKSNKSIERSKKSSICLAKILGEAGVSIIPGGATAFKLAELGVEHFMNYRRDRAEDRLIEFHSEILEGIPEEKRDDFLNKSFSMEDYYNLLNMVIQDQESEKIELYAKLFQGMILGTITQKYKSHLIKTIRDLTQSDLELMRDLYIQEIKGTSPIRTTFDAKKTANNFKDAYSFQTLLRLGYLAPSSNNVEPYLITDLLRFTVKFFFDIDLDKFIPVYKRPMKVFLAFDKGEADNKALLKILTALQNNGINTVCAYPSRKSPPLLIAPIIVLCVKRKGDLLDTIKKHVRIEDKKITQLILPGGELDALPYPERDFFDLRSISSDEINRLISYVKGKSKIDQGTTMAHSQKVKEHKSLL